MAQMQLTSQRKSPQQARSKATVEAILEGTAQVLMGLGYAKMTTTKVAKRAGVSVGTLYQYFADKEALVRALWAMRSARTKAAMAEAAMAEDAATAEQRIEAVLGAVLRTKSEHPDLTTQLNAAMTEIDGKAHLRRMQDENMTMVRGLIAAHADELPVEDVELAAFVTVNAIEGVIAAAVATRPIELDDPALLNALTGMLFRYLAG